MVLVFRHGQLGVGKCWGTTALAHQTIDPLLSIVHPAWHNRLLKSLMRQGDTSMPKYEFSKEREWAFGFGFGCFPAS
jgi:hypothetical protein